MAKAPITLLLVQPQTSESSELLETLEPIVARYMPMVELRVVDRVPDSFGRRIAGAAPIVLVIRGGSIIGEAMGSRLPARELDRVIRCAVEWPANAA